MLIELQSQINKLMVRNNQQGSSDSLGNQNNNYYNKKNFRYQNKNHVIKDCSKPKDWKSPSNNSARSSVPNKFNRQDELKDREITTKVVNRVTWYYCDIERYRWNKTHTIKKHEKIKIKKQTQNQEQ